MGAEPSRRPRGGAAPLLAAALAVALLLHCAHGAASGLTAKARQAASAPAAPVSAPGSVTSQAGCACMSSWYDASGNEHSGCANPNSDPRGAWCQVNPETCPGFYGVVTNTNGSVVFFDYCSVVREITNGGCLCASEWNTLKAGKPLYRDGCASPLLPGGKRICRVDQSTCPPNSAIAEYDECVAKPDNPAAAQTQPEGEGQQAQQQEEDKELQELEARLGGASPQDSTRTFAGCACRSSWPYKYADGAVANFTGCSNPDGDPLGAWCAVDPISCPSFAGEIALSANETVAYDYCHVRFHQQVDESVCSYHLKVFDQCGGKRSCSKYGCSDAPWPGTCCSVGLVCHRQNAFYHQCLTPEHVAALEGGAEEDDDELAPAPAGGGAAASGAGGRSAGAAPLAPRDPGEPLRVYTKLKIGMDYEQLASSPERMAAFKSDIVAWLRTVAGNPKIVESVGVDEVLKGSVIALAFVQFRPGTPPVQVEAATERLTTQTSSLYTQSHLPEAWGSLVSYLVAPNPSALAGGDGPGEGAAAANGAVQKGRNAGLWAGAAAGIAVGAAVVLATVGLLVARALRDQQRKIHDADLAAKLDYQGDLTEGELDGLKEPDAPQSAAAAAAAPQIRDALAPRCDEPEGNDGEALQQVCVGEASGQNRLWSWLYKPDSPHPYPTMLSEPKKAQPSPATAALHGSDGGSMITRLSRCSDGDRVPPVAAGAQQRLAGGALSQGGDSLAGSSFLGTIRWSYGGSSMVTATSNGGSQFGKPASASASAGGIAFASLKQRRISTASSSHSSSTGGARDPSSIGGCEPPATIGASRLGAVATVAAAAELHKENHDE